MKKSTKGLAATVLAAMIATLPALILLGLSEIAPPPVQAASGAIVAAFAIFEFVRFFNRQHASRCIKRKKDAAL